MNDFCRGVSRGTFFLKPVTKIRDSNQFKLVQQFIGQVNYYRNMLPRQSHTLAPLTRIFF